MAELLNTLTMDGTSMNVLNDRFPSGDINMYYGSNASVSIANATEQSWDLWTAPSDGIVIASMSVTFNSGSGYRSLIAKRDGSEIGTAERVSSASNVTCRLTIPIIIYVNAGQKLQMVVSQGSGAALAVTGRFLNGVFIPDVVGGVVRHLKNLICYRPLKRKAVA